MKFDFNRLSDKFDSVDDSRGRGRQSVGGDDANRKT